MKNQVFIPTVPKFGRKDVEGSWDIQQPLVAAGYSQGLMVFTHGGIKTVSDPEIISKQYENLRHVDYGDSPIVTMLSNIPIGQMDWYHETETALEHAHKGVDFAKALPIGGRRIVTFHTNTLMSKDEFDSESAENWRRLFKERVLPGLREIGDYSKSVSVDVLVETCPAPEFGDINHSDPKNADDIYRGAQFAELRNPFYLTSRGLVRFNDIRESGLGICVDVCHNFVTYQTAKDNDPDGFLHTADVSALASGSVLNDVKSLTPKDLVHLADVRGRYSRENGTVFYEGLVLGEGDNTQLPEISAYINSQQIPFVLETKDKDFSVRHETKKSIEWVLTHG